MTLKSRRISTENPKPNAWVVNDSDRGRKSIKSGNRIYLQDGQNFQIELHNPLTESVLADVRVNGNSVSKTGIVLRPAERFYLDCFVEDKKKFIFKTYEVEDTSESKKSISKNGTVEVFFYKEETFSVNNWINKFDKIIEKHYYPYYYPYPSYPTYPSYLTYPSYPTCTRVTWGVYNGTNITGGGFTTNNIVGSLNNTNTSSNLSIINDGSFNMSSLDMRPKYSNECSFNEHFNSKIETGRIEKGEESKQEFSEIDMEFEKYHISSVLYQILPESQKPVETTDIKKRFCHECGTKSLKDMAKFCHECGTKL